nr:hypothetical protein Iba_chr04bCG5290 [Ipomoea batatas]
MDPQPVQVFHQSRENTAHLEIVYEVEALESADCALHHCKVAYEQQQFSTIPISYYYPSHWNFLEILLFHCPQTYKSTRFSWHIHLCSSVVELNRQYQILLMQPPHLDKFPSHQGQNH